MTENCKYFSRTGLIAIYLLLKALRKGADRVKLTESCIRSFLGRERLHNSAIWDIAHWWRPYFPYAEVQHKSLFLYVAKQDNADKEEEFSKDLNSLSTQVRFMKALNFYKLEKEGLISQLDKLRNQFKKLQKEYKTEVVDSIPDEINEELVAKEVAECIFKYKSMKSIISQKQTK
jgi:hypothetical protein